MYTSSDPITNEEHETLFFNSDNPFINRLNEEQQNLAETDLSANECLSALKNMKNGSSPGIDGFTAEFYKFFWKDIQYFLLNSFNFSFQKGSFSTSQKQGLITCIPKEGKSKTLLKNWRPITLLNVDIKIASAALANRIKPFLHSIISETQQGFVKGRYIGECTRLIYDIIESADEEKLPGLLLLIDFEKAFDTLEWSFIDKSLRFLGFGPNYCKWVKTLYNDSQSCIINNGHCSEYFKIHRGVRQGDPLSPYLFILCLELLSASLKNDPAINGIKINDSEYLLSQYADDSSIILDGSEQSLRKTLDILDKFSECAGLRANLEKTEAIWFGSKLGNEEKLAPDKNLNWNETGKFKLLGIKFDMHKDDITSVNYSEKIAKIKSLLNTWTLRDLTLLGKITVIKSLALPILIQTLTVLPNPPKNVINEINDIFFSFLWSGKPDKIKRKIICKSYEEGGLKMPDIESFCYSLKMTWIHKLLDPLNISPWKNLFMDKYLKYGADKIWMLPPQTLKFLSRKFNSFWHDILQNWSLLRNELEDTPEDVLKQPIWFNENLKTANKTVFYKNWVEAGVFYINDLLDENNELMSLAKFTETYNIQTTFLHYLSLIHMIPRHWKDKISQTQKLEFITDECLDFVKNNRKNCQFFYRKFLSLQQDIQSKQQTKWSEQLQIREIDTWNYFYSLPFSYTKNNKIISFQYKILHRILATNSFLFKCRLKETELCSFCQETKETIVHLFWDCMIIKNLWIDLTKLLEESCDVIIPSSVQDIILGSNQIDLPTNYFIVLIKHYIYSCWCRNEIPNVNGTINYLKQAYKTEKLSGTLYGHPSVGTNIDRKWSPLSNIIT